GIRGIPPGTGRSRTLRPSGRRRCARPRLRAQGHPPWARGFSGADRERGRISVLATRRTRDRLVAHARHRIRGPEGARPGSGTLITDGPPKNPRIRNMATKDDVISILRKCYDPEIPINIYDLGLVYNIELRSEEHTSELQSPDHLVC